MTTTTAAAAPSSWVTPEIDDLCVMMSQLDSPDEVRTLLRDLCTLPEIEAMAHRWQVVKLVDQGVPYTAIARDTGASTATVTRVAYWLRHGEGGYRRALDAQE